jgi:hypothetical protein
MSDEGGYAVPQGVLFNGQRSNLTARGQNRVKIKLEGRRICATPANIPCSHHPVPMILFKSRFYCTHSSVAQWQSIRLLTGGL